MASGRFLNVVWYYLSVTKSACFDTYLFESLMRKVNFTDKIKRMWGAMYQICIKLVAPYEDWGVLERIKFVRGKFLREHRI